MSYELILRASYENNKEVLYKSPNIDGDFVIRGYTNPNDAPPLHRAGIINDACFNLLSSTNTYPNVSIDTINTSNATLASEDFTISFWCNIQKDSIAQNTVLFSATDGDNYSWSTTKGTFLLLGNPVRLLYDNTTYLTSKNTLKLVDGKNHFICIERKNDTLYVFIDGKLEIEDDITTRFGVAHYPFANVKFSVGNGGAEDSDGTRTLKRSMLVDGYTLIKGICIWDKEFTPPKRDAWDLISNGYLDTTGLAYYHNKIVEYINKNSIVRQNNHLYNKDDIVRFNNMWIKCMIGGTTASTPPTLTTEEIGTTITDGGVTWTVVKYALTTDVPPLASALATPRKIELTGNVTGSADFDGSKDIQIATSLSDAYLPLSGGEVTGAVNFKGGATGNWTGTVGGGHVAFEDTIIKGFDSKQDQNNDFVFARNIYNAPMLLVSVVTFIYRNTGSSQSIRHFGVLSNLPSGWEYNWLYSKEFHNFIDYIGSTYAITAKSAAPLTINVSFKAQSQDTATLSAHTRVWVKQIGG